MKVKRILADMREIHSILSRINEQVRPNVKFPTATMRIPTNSRCFDSIQQIDLTPMYRMIEHLQTLEQDTTAVTAATLRAIAKTLCLPIVERCAIKQNETNAIQAIDITIVHPFDSTRISRLRRHTHRLHIVTNH